MTLIITILDFFIAVNNYIILFEDKYYRRLQSIRSPNIANEECKEKSNQYKPLTSILIDYQKKEVELIKKSSAISLELNSISNSITNNDNTIGSGGSGS
jgi:hypothetical protein